MRIALFGSSAAAYADGLAAALVRLAEVGMFVEGPGAEGATEDCRLHDLTAVHYRNVLFRYDVVVYLLSKSGIGAKMADALCEWPGVAIVIDDDGYDAVAREPRLRRALGERMLAVIVHSRAAAKRLHELWSPVFEVEPPRDRFDEVAREVLEVCRNALARSEGWLETLLETACAELPGFVPGDRDAPWRAEVDELCELAGRRQRSS
jgi:hypothetical protein